MNVKLFSRPIGSKYVIIRLGWFNFGKWSTKTNRYSEYRLGLFLIKIEDWK